MAYLKMTEAEKIEAIKEKLGDRLWRLNHLYKIQDATGKQVTFKLNAVQQKLYDNIWYLNDILKARQEGISTFLNIYFLDICLWNENKSAGIICDTLANAKNFLEDKIKYAYENLDDWIKEAIKIKSYSKSADNAGIWFSNGSSIRVGTSFRSGTLQYLHVSELGKISKTSPDKAKEIQSGALNTVQVGQQVFIESTAEGAEGLFYDITKKAEDLQITKTELTKMDFKFHFFAWHEDEKYAMAKPASFKFSKASEKYFEDLRCRGISLDEDQKFWYVKKKESQGDAMFKEFPSYSEEAFIASSEAKYWADLIRKIRSNNRICEFEPDEALDVHTTWDLGIGKDSMTIWFFQVFGKEIRIIDYYEAHGEGFSHYARVLKDKGYNYGKHFAPFDIMVQEMGAKGANGEMGATRLETAEMAGIYFERVEHHAKDNKVKIQSALPKLSLEEGRDLVRALIPNCYFKLSTTERGVECLEKYSKKWNEALGGWGDQKKDEYEQGASSFRYLATAVKVLDVPDDSNTETEEYARARAIPTPRPTRNFE